MEPDWSALTPEQKEDFMNGAAMMPPDGEIQNYENPPNRNAMGLAITGICLALSTFVVLVRAYARVFLSKRCRLEDALGFLAFVFCVCHIWSIIAMTEEFGFFSHQWNFRFRQIGVWMQQLNYLRTFYFLTLAFSKNAILLEWTRIFVPWPNRNTFYWLCHGIIAINTMLYTAAVVATYLGCIPADSAWIPWVQGRCINRRAFDIFVMSFNLLTDVIILFLPQRVIWKLNLKRKQRIGVSFIFSIGLMTVACATGRVQILATLDYMGDGIYETCKVVLWGVGEATCLLMVFCIPSFPKAFGGEDGMISRLGRTLRSWARITASAGSSPAHSEGTHSWRIPTYERMEGESQTQLKELSSTMRKRHMDDPESQGGILRTTEFVADEGTASDPYPNPEIGWQHPWMKTSGGHDSI